jgi:flagellar biosynthesis anti-sigma factor FlgM
MRIDLTNSGASQIGGESDMQKVDSRNVESGNAPGSEDRATLSSDKASVESLVNVAMNSPEVRQDKVASLQQAINSGQYNLDPAAIAASMLDEQA